MSPVRTACPPVGGSAVPPDQLSPGHVVLGPAVPPDSRSLKARHECPTPPRRAHGRRLPRRSTVAYAHAEGAPPARPPVPHDEGHRRAAMLEASVLQRRLLIDTRSDEDDGRQQRGIRPWVRRHPRRLPPKAATGCPCLHLTRNLINPRRTIAARVTVVDQSVCLSFCLSVTTIPSWHRYCKITLKQPADNTRSDSTVRNRIAGYFAIAL